MIAYYAIFSLPGLLVVIVTLAGYFFGSDAINNHLATHLTSAFGAATAKQIQDMKAAATESKNSVWAAILGIVTILAGATGVLPSFRNH